MNIALLGYGAIGRTIAATLSRGDINGAELLGVVARTPGVASRDGHRQLDLDGAISESDLIVECASVSAVEQLGPRVIRAGKDLLIVSVGALIDPTLRQLLLHDGPGRSFLSTGAIGGLDLLSAAAGGLEHAKITTTKSAPSLVRPWMSPDTIRELEHGSDRTMVFDGTVRAAIEKFPASVNVSVALAAATGLWEKTQVTLIADPNATQTVHQIHAHGALGDYEFSIRNRPLADNPRSSALVPAAALSAIRRLVDPSGTFI